MTKTSPVSIRLEADLNDKVAHIAEALDRPKSWVIEQAVRDFVAVREWQLSTIDEGIKAADAGKLIPYEDVVAWVSLLGKPRGVAHAEMRIVWTPRALGELAAVRACFARDTPAAAAAQIERIFRSFSAIPFAYSVSASSK